MTVRVAALWLIVLTAACASLSRDEDAGEWVGGEVEAPSERVVREMITTSLGQLGYPLGSGMDPVTQTATSGWKTSLHPFHKRGHRLQAEIRYTAIEAGRFDVQVRIRKEINEELARPLDLRYAAWAEDADDVASARVLLHQIRSAFEPDLALTEEDAEPLAPWTP